MARVKVTAEQLAKLTSGAGVEPKKPRRKDRHAQRGAGGLIWNPKVAGAGRKCCAECDEKQADLDRAIFAMRDHRHDAHGGVVARPSSLEGGEADGR